MHVSTWLVVVGICILYNFKLIVTRRRSLVLSPSFCRAWMHVTCGFGILSANYTFNFLITNYVKEINFLY